MTEPVKSFEFYLAGLESELVFRAQPAPVPRHEVTGFGGTAELSDLVIVADEQFNIGSAWYCVNERTGRVYRVSPEYGTAVEFVNSDFEKFISCLRAAAEWSTNNNSEAIKEDPACVDDLANAISAIDGAAVSSPDDHWAALIDHIRVCASDADDEMEFWFRVA